MGAKKLRESDVTFKLQIEPCQVQIRGNAMASGDAAQDRETEEWILSELDRGNEWAWCDVTVWAIYGSDGELRGRDHLGCCSYTSEKDFRAPGGYFDDMKVVALAELQAQVDQLAPLVCAC